MLKSKRILDQLHADQHNIQELINRLPQAETKSEYRGIAATIKILVKEIKQQKQLVYDKISHRTVKHDLALFEVEIPEPEIDYSEINSI